MKGFSLKRLTLDAVLSAVALIIFVLESRIPNLAPVPGMKLGLANIVTVWSMFALGPLDTLAVLLIRIILGSVFAGSVTSFFFSLAGGMLCYLVQLFLRKILNPKQIFVAGILGKVCTLVPPISAKPSLLSALLSIGIRSFTFPPIKLSSLISP